MDYVESAKKWVENSIEAQVSTTPHNEVLATAYATIAQTHATLALVEQQRVANLIRLAQMRSEVDEVEGQSYSLASEALWTLTEMRPVQGQTDYQATNGPEEYVAVREDIRSALGLGRE